VRVEAPRGRAHTAITPHLDVGSLCREGWSERVSSRKASLLRPRLRVAPNVRWSRWTRWMPMPRNKAHHWEVFRWDLNPLGERMGRIRKVAFTSSPISLTWLPDRGHIFNLSDMVNLSIYRTPPSLTKRAHPSPNIQRPAARPRVLLDTPPPLSCLGLVIYALADGVSFPHNTVSVWAELDMCARPTTTIKRLSRILRFYLLCIPRLLILYYALYTVYTTHYILCILRLLILYYALYTVYTTHYILCILRSLILYYAR
jgi:hypothetical protein